MRLSNPVQGVNLEDFHRERECQRSARQSALLDSVLGENLDTNTRNWIVNDLLGLC